MEEKMRAFSENWKRTIYCGMVAGSPGEEIPVAVNGWVRKRRDLGGLIFIELWDHTGAVQVVFNPEILLMASAPRYNIEVRLTTTYNSSQNTAMIMATVPL